METDFGSWWAAKELIEKIYWILAVPFSLLFLIQLVMTLVAGDADADMSDPDLSSDSDTGMFSQFFTIKNMIAFFTMVGWSGLGCLSMGLSPALTILISFGAGSLMVVIMTFMFSQVSKLTETGSLIMKNAVGQLGEVYLRIPAARSGYGKIHVKVQGSLRELDALTDDPAEIATGSIVQITGIINDQVLIVSRNHS